MRAQLGSAQDVTVLCGLMANTIKPQFKSWLQTVAKFDALLMVESRRAAVQVGQEVDNARQMVWGFAGLPSSSRR